MKTKLAAVPGMRWLCNGLKFSLPNGVLGWVICVLKITSNRGTTRQAKAYRMILDSLKEKN